MVDRQQAQQIAGLKASALLLEEYEVEVADEPERWVITYVPRARGRGGGFQLFEGHRRGLAGGEISVTVPPGGREHFRHLTMKTARCCISLCGGTEALPSEDHGDGRREREHAPERSFLGRHDSRVCPPGRPAASRPTPGRGCRGGPPLRPRLLSGRLPVSAVSGGAAGSRGGSRTGDIPPGVAPPRYI